MIHLELATEAFSFSSSEQGKHENCKSKCKIKVCNGKLLIYHSVKEIKGKKTRRVFMAYQISAISTRHLIKAGTKLKTLNWQGSEGSLKVTT